MLVVPVPVVPEVVGGPVVGGLVVSVVLVISNGIYYKIPDIVVKVVRVGTNNEV